MIFYYSATGNTRYAARYLAGRLGTSAIDILDCGDIPSSDGPVGLMCPIYCWGIPPVFRRFLERLIPSVPADSYLFAVSTCGDEAGTAMKTLDRFLNERRGKGADGMWSLQMPNTYVLLPGFDVDSEKVERAKLEKAPQRLDDIAAMINRRERGVYDVVEGSVPALRSAVFPLFERWGVTPKWWSASEGCIGCGRCSRICPAKNVAMTDGHPVWGNVCFSCCACFHCCPAKAISYSWFTRGKSQYLCPLNG